MKQKGWLILDLDHEMSFRVRVKVLGNSISLCSEIDYERIYSTSEFMRSYSSIVNELDYDFNSQGAKQNLFCYLTMLKFYFEEEFRNTKMLYNQNMHSILNEFNMIKKLNHKLVNENTKIRNEVTSYKKDSNSNFNSTPSKSGKFNTNSFNNQNLTGRDSESKNSEDTKSYELLINMLENEKRKNAELLLQNQDLQYKCTEVNDKALDLIKDAHKSVDDQITTLESK